MNKKILKAEERKVTGRKVKNLRTSGLVPANIFGKKVKSLSIQVNKKEFETVYKEAGETGLIDLEIGKDVKPVLVHGVQINAKTEDLLHIDFLQVDLKTKVTAQVPVELIGESPTTKQGIGTVVQQINEIEVEALPADLPERFEADIETLVEVDQAIYVKDLKFDKSKVEILTDMESIVAKVEPPQKEEVQPEPEAPTEGEAAPATEQKAEGEAAETTES